MTVFADTFALIAWLNPRDNAHELVSAYLDEFTGRLVTTEWVLMELADALSVPEARSTVVAFLNAVRGGCLTLLGIFRPCTRLASSCLRTAKTKPGPSQIAFRSE